MFLDYLYLTNEALKLYLRPKAFEVEAWTFYKSKNPFMGGSTQLWLWS
jgi:hypothetical protein